MKLAPLDCLATTAILAALAFASGCSDADPDTRGAPAPAPPPVDTALAAAADAPANRPSEIYFDLTAFTWYREGRPLIHDGRPYMPQADPIAVAAELREAGRYEGVSYYVMEDAAEPVYTVYVPVYYRYWQRFTSPPGS